MATSDQSAQADSVTAYDDEVVVDGLEPSSAMHAVAFANGWVVGSAARTSGGRRIRLVRISP